jgi:hypothetical protein
MSIDLVAKGIQDAYLTGNPEVSFFRQQYKRHTNFAQRSVKIIPQGTLAPGQTVSLKIPNKGDLLGYVWLDLGQGTVCDLDTSNAASYLNPESAINSCGIWADSDQNTAIFELYIGGQLIDRQDSVFMVQHWQKFLLDKSSAAPAASNAGNIYTSTWLPLHFFFCDSVYLPLVALQYHEVEIRIQFSGASGSALSPATTATNMANIKFYANYILLDTEERTALVNKDQDYLIEQVQKITFNSNKCDLSFLNHPVKCITWGQGDPAYTPNPSSNTVQLYLNVLKCSTFLCPTRCSTRFKVTTTRKLRRTVWRGPSISFRCTRLHLKRTSINPAALVTLAGSITALYNSTPELLLTCTQSTTIF